jgi:hypothetical protein
MKKILQFLFLGCSTMAVAQTPIQHFSFNGNVTNDAGNISFATTVPATNYYWQANENGTPNTAVALNGTPFKAVIPNLPQGNAPRTVMIKVLSAFGMTENPIFSYGTASANQAFGLTHVDTSPGTGNVANNKLVAYLWGANTFEYQACGITNTNFYLLTMTFDGTTLKVYKDTQLVFWTNVTMNTSGTDFYLNSILGPQVASSNTIKVDDLKIYDVALTQDQVTANYLDAGTNFNTGLLAFYDFQYNLDSYTGTHNLTPYNGNYPNFYLGVEGTPSSKSASFEGTTAAYNTTLAAAFNNSEYTIAYWEWGINTTVYNPYGTTYELFGSHYSRRDVNGIYQTGAYVDPTATWMIEAIGTFYTSGWLHKAFVFKYNVALNRTEINEYENGTLVFTTHLTGQLTLHHFNNKFTIGSGTDAAGNMMASKFGKISLDKFFIYSKALTKKEINVIKDQHERVFTLPLAVADFNQSNLEVSLYPNPVRDILNIEIENDIQSIEIYNIQGQKVLSSNQKQINVSDLASGMYLVRIQDIDNNIATKKISIK